MNCKKCKKFSDLSYRCGNQKSPKFGQYVLPEHACEEFINLDGTVPKEEKEIHQPKACGICGTPRGMCDCEGDYSGLYYPFVSQD